MKISRFELFQDMVEHLEIIDFWCQD